MLQTTSAFTRLWALGYARIVPVIPPDAQVSENSTLYKRVNTRQDARGKLPGVKGRNGLWHSWDWTQHVTDPDDFARWEAMGAGAGIVTGDGLLAIDADTTDEALAKTIRDAIKDHLGATPIRVGRYPKALYLIRVTDPYAYRRIDFGAADEHGNYERVEILSDRKFFVAEGTHPKTGKPYTWPRELVPYDDLPLFRPEQIDALMDALRTALPAASKVHIEGGGETPINQAALRGDAKTVAKAVRATPNISAYFPTREAYRDMGYAIKAAITDDREAFDLWAEWCDRWEDGTNDPDIMRADWQRMKPPFRRGAGWLYEQAERYSGGHFTAVNAHFEPVAQSAPSPFDLQAEAEREEAQTDLYPILTINELANRPPPTFLIDRHIPDVSVGFLYSAPGVGKSFMALDMALCIAHGLETWQGEKVTTQDGKRAVVYIAAEGSFDLGLRIKAWHAARGLTPGDAPFYVIETTIDFMQPEDVAKLDRTVRSVGKAVAFVVVDTVSRAMPGADENAQKDMTLFVRACDAVRDRFKCAVLGVHHASKSGDLRGSTVLRGAGDYVMRLEKRTGTIRALEMEKQKAAPDGWTSQFSFAVWSLGEGVSSLVVERVDGDTLPGGGRNPASGLAVLEAMDRAWAAGVPWASAHQSRERYAVRRVCADFGYSREEAEAMVSGWVTMGLISEEVRDAKAHVKGYRVKEGALTALSGGTDGGGVSGVCQIVFNGNSVFD